MKHASVRKLALVGVMAALVFATSMYLQIPIPVGGDSTRLHLGNVMCLLSGMLLGPVCGGLSAGIGSVIFDLINPAYIASAPFTFFFKFAMGFLCGWIVSGKETHVLPRHIIGSVTGALTYVVLYLSKSFIEYHYVQRMELQAALPLLGTKAVVSVTNGVIAAVVSVVLGMTLRPLWKKLFA